jgi:hypothetical protein
MFRSVLCAFDQNGVDHANADIMMRSETITCWMFADFFRSECFVLMLFDILFHDACPILFCTLYTALVLEDGGKERNTRRVSTKERKKKEMQIAFDGALLSTYCVAIWLELH